MSNNTDTKDDGTSAFKKALEKGGEAQRDFIKSFSSIQQEGFQNFFTMPQGLSYYNAMFKTTVQSGGRISIPEAERQALNIEEGDLVQVILIPIERRRRGTKQNDPSVISSVTIVSYCDRVLSHCPTFGRTLFCE